MGKNNLEVCDKCNLKGSKELFNKCYEHDYKENKEDIDKGRMTNTPILCICNKCWDGRKFTDCNSYWSKKACNQLDYSEACLKCPRNILRKCPGFENCNSKKAKIRKQNTAYVRSCFNYTLMCDKCMKENEEHWKEMWSDYYSQVL